MAFLFYQVFFVILRIFWNYLHAATLVALSLSYLFHGVAEFMTRDLTIFYLMDSFALRMDRSFQSRDSYPDPCDKLKCAEDRVGNLFLPTCESHIRHPDR